jgi:hypothetical protein
MQLTMSTDAGNVMVAALTTCVGSVPLIVQPPEVRATDTRA